ncbi:uncharacterized protein LOC117115348 [Anneissia japonica]|uniref:uncharacterized protein LOC117115348 n=1 Tax=Anneissia japonica TaxID=1529436 RepID=UPI001425726C|nr:uncharacterized protein LOC117115348 [Anneissia japonica]
MKNRKKRVQFSLNHNLHRSESLSKDLRLLRCENYELAGPYESHVFGERYDLNNFKAHVTLTEGNFWDFLYSSGWNDFSSIRVTDGSLMRTLLYTYFMLELNEKLVSYTTEVYEHNISTAIQGPKVHDESIKITFTYYGRNKASLRKILEQDGIRNPQVHFSDEHQRGVHGKRVPNLTRDSTRRRFPCSMNCDLLANRDYYRPDSSSVVIPENPPNSPLSEYPRPSTMEMLRQKKIERVRELASCKQKKRTFSDLPVITQARIKRSCDAEITSNFEVVGTKVERDTTDDIISWLENEISIQEPIMKSALQLPKIEEKQPKTSTCSTNKFKHHSSRKLKSQVHIYRKHSPRLEFINVINRINGTTPTPPARESPPATPEIFDTDKLRINYSLEHIRPEIVRKPTNVKQNTRENDMEVSLKLPVLHQNDLKEHGSYMLTKQDRQYQRDEDVAASGDKWTCDHTDDLLDSDEQSRKMPSVPLDELFKARIPQGFAESCLNSVDDFVVRKEQITTSRLYVTLTTITFNRIPIVP